MSRPKKQLPTMGSTSAPDNDGTMKENSVERKGANSSTSELPGINDDSVFLMRDQKISPLSLMQESLPTGNEMTLTDKLSFYARNTQVLNLFGEIGSGLNFKRRKFLKILERICASDISTLVVAYAVFAVRFGFPLIEWHR